MYRLLLFLVMSFVAVAAQAQESAAIDLFPEEDLDRSTIAINAFGNESAFGSPSQQFQEIRNTLGIDTMRLLFAWSNEVQPGPSVRPDFSFYDDLIKSIPPGSQAIIVIANLPAWMHQSENWRRNDPGFTLFRRWIRKVVLRYRRKRKVIGFQIWNEPNDVNNMENQVLGYADSPEQYVALANRSARLIRRRAKKKKVIGAATTSIIQNFPETLDYNQAMADAGLENHVDIWGLHIYGTSLERFYFGVFDFLDELSVPIWVTESGAKGVFEQKEYVRRVWPLLKDEIPGIEKFFYYRFAEATDPASTFGLKNPSRENPVSDLYIYLRDELP